jgi:hypothetical protein
MLTLANSEKNHQQKHVEGVKESMGALMLVSATCLIRITLWLCQNSY